MNKKFLQQVLGFGISLILIYFVFLEPQPVAWFRGRSAEEFPIDRKQLVDPALFVETVHARKRTGDVVLANLLTQQGQNLLMRWDPEEPLNDTLVTRLIEAANVAMTLDSLPYFYGHEIQEQVGPLPKNASARDIHKRNRIVIQAAYPKMIKGFPFTAMQGWLKPRFNMKDLGEALAILRPLPSFLAFLTLIVSLYVRSWRWKLLVEPFGGASFFQVFYSTNVGYLLNNVLPFRIGEVVRGILLARKANLPIPATLTTCALDRVFDLLGLGMIFGVSLLTYSFPEWMRIGGAVLIVGVIGGLFVGYILSRTPDRIERKLSSFTADRGPMIKRFADMLVSLLRGLAVLKDWKIMIQVLLTTFFLWFLYALAMEYVLDAFSLTRNESLPELQGFALIQSMAITVVSALGMSIPSAPGAVGTYHKSVMIGLDFFGVPGSIAAIFATTMHALNYLTLTLMGVFSLWRLDLSFSELMKLYERHAETGEAEAPQESEPEKK